MSVPLIISVLILVVALTAVIFGADWLVDGASAIARKSGISEFVIGLTIVGFGTSCPELVVSLTGAITGNSDVSIGNVVGSNILNTLLILGLTAVITPIAITEANKRRDIPLTLAATLLLILCGMGFTWHGVQHGMGISRAEGIGFLVLFALYIYSCFKNDDKSAVEEAELKEMGSGKAVALIILGLAGLIIGGKYFVSSATDIAHAIGISDKFVAITVLAGGTSLPELATCVIAAAKKKGQLALGNILGSNVFNILLILGCAATVRPIGFAGMNWVDMGVLLLSALLVLFSAYSFNRGKIDKIDGALMLLCEAAYFTWLCIQL